ncbi:hypothetical protein [Flavobacterium sp. BFFFF1]|uniref:hypothetical protein n=1 Tax=Flavobacterium sp. BFFFF1 TaxID=2015557 RepID=UPI0025C2612B|nr:hypothetical protein [Flavobacterium sp. BFFFF1]
MLSLNQQSFLTLFFQFMPMLQKSITSLFFVLFFCFSGFSQVNPKPVKKDSAAMYRKIEKYSKRSKFMKTMHKFVFEPIEKKKSNPIRKPKKLKYKSFEGKIVRKIEVQTLDPFGYSINDVNRKPKNWAERTGNRIHIKSSQLAIRNLLLIKKNRPLDTLLVRESERLVRSQRYVNSVIIDAEPTNSPDSVDVYVRVLDSWSLIPRGSISSSRTSIELEERNFLGSGHQFENKFTNRIEDGKNAYRMKYTIPNILNSFVKTTVIYQIDLDDFYSKSVNIERPFYSPYAKWAGGIYLDEQFRQDSLQDKDMNYSKQNLKYFSQDAWGAHAVRIFNGNTEDERTTNLILSGRALRIQYSESPDVAYDSINFFTGEKFYMAGIGISSRQFVEDRYIFNYGIVEDVPVGKIYSITAGYQYKNEQERFYVGGRASFGNYFIWGYLATNFEYGTFFRDGAPEQTAFSFQATYFTNLLESGKWKFRQFIKPQLILGTNRLNSIGDRLTINESSGFQGNYGAGFQGNNSAGIRGFNSAIYGTKKLVLALQTQAYSPWNLWGFRLNPYLNYTAAVIGNDRAGITKSKVYSSIGIGLIINNDYLVFSSFQLSLAYYPTIPGEGSNLTKTNTFETTDFGLQDFELGKPRTIIYK